MINIEDILQETDKYKKIAKDPYADSDILGLLFFAWPALVYQNPSWIFSKMSSDIERGFNIVLKNRDEFLFNSGFDRLREAGIYFEGLSYVPDYIVESPQCKELIAQKLSDSTLDKKLILRNMGQWDLSDSVKEIIKSLSGD